MNDRHPSGYAPDYGAYGYDPYSTGSYQNVGTTFADGDPLFGAMTGTEDTGATGSYAFVPQPAQNGYDATVYETGSYDASGFWQAQTGSYPTYPEQSQQQPHVPSQHQPQHHQQQFQQQEQQQRQDWDSGQYPAYGYNAPGQDTGSYPTGTYDAMSWDTGGYTLPPQAAPAEHGYAPEPVPGYAGDTAGAPQYGTGYGATYENEYGAGYTDAYAYEPENTHEHDLAHEPDAGLHPDHDPDADPDPEPDDAVDLDAEPESDAALVPAAPRAGGNGSRRKRPAKRSALLTIAVPSVAVMGVAACAAAAITDVPGAAHATTRTEAAGTGATNPVASKLDTQLAGVTSDADDFASRASRTQERIDLKDREAAAKKAKADAAARKEAARPKFLLPVKERGLSAYFGQSGVNWMALHTGIDFPVDTGTPVSSVTDGTIRTQWNGSYGNMAIVTAPDGTETWYCHLSSTKIRSGPVKAGQVIAYSGDTGNTTGPHLHFEVRPHGGSPIDPLPWLLAHGLDPR